MSTPVLKVITEYCANDVRDDRLEELRRDDPPLYARKMWYYLRRAIPYFTTPSYMPEYLVGTEENPKITEPTYDSYKYLVESDLTEETTVSLGDDYKGYELFCARLMIFDRFGNIYYRPVSNITYDSDEGTITVSADEENPVPMNTVFDLDFYTDGEFENTLTVEMMSILAICFQIAWQTPQGNDYLANTPMIEDGSFKLQNKANKQRADDERLQNMEARLSAEMRRYEQNLAFRKAFPNGAKIY